MQSIQHRRRHLPSTERQGAVWKETLDTKSSTSHKGARPSWWYPTVNAMKTMVLQPQPIAIETDRYSRECPTQPITKVKKGKRPQRKCVCLQADMCKAYDVSYNVYHERRQEKQWKTMTNPAKQIIPYERPDGPVVII